MSFSIKRLTGGRAVVSGTDTTGATGSVVVDTHQWDSINQHDKQHVAEDVFNATVARFFAPIVAAGEALNATLAQVQDPDEFVVLHEEVEEVRYQPADIVRLTHDSMVLRIVEQGDHSRLLWVGDSLEILEAVKAPAVDPLQEAIDLVSKPVSEGGLGAEGIVLDPTGQALVSDAAAAGDQA